MHAQLAFGCFTNGPQQAIVAIVTLTEFKWFLFNVPRTEYNKYIRNKFFLYSIVEWAPVHSSPWLPSASLFLTFYWYIIMRSTISIWLRREIMFWDRIDGQILVDIYIYITGINWLIWIRWEEIGYLTGHIIISFNGISDKYIANFVIGWYNNCTCQLHKKQR